MDGLAFVEGKTIDLKDARVPLLDRGFLLGDGLFETLRTVNGAVFRLDDHAARIAGGLEAIGLDPALEGLFREAVTDLVASGREAFGDELYVRVNMTTGVMEDIAGDGQGVSVTGVCKKFKPYPMQYYSRGVHLVLSRQRLHSASPLAGVKTLSFMPYVAARREAMAATAHDGVLRNEHDRIVEATTSNLFARSNDTVYAPGRAEGAVAGITRDIVLDLVEDTGLEVVERLEEQALESAAEAWVTNTTGGVVPVTKYNDRPIGGGGKGDFATRLGHAYEDLVRGR